MRDWMKSCVVVVAVAFPAVSCKKAPAPLPKFEHVSPSPVGTTQKILEKTKVAIANRLIPIRVLENQVAAGRRQEMHLRVLAK